MEEQSNQAQKLAEDKELPIDFLNLTELLWIMPAARLLNEFHFINPAFPLDRKSLLNSPAMDVFAGVVKILTESSQWLESPGVPQH